MTTAPTDLALASISPDGADGVADFDVGGFDGCWRVRRRLNVTAWPAPKAAAAFHDARIHAVVDGVEFAVFSFDGEVVGSDFGDGTHHAPARRCRRHAAAISPLP